MKEWIRNLIPPVFIWRNAYRKAKAVDIKLSSQNNNIYIFLAADYGNLGDIAITYAQNKLLRMYFPNYNIIEVPSKSSLSEIKGYCRNIKKTDILTIVGGGNMGDLYAPLENMRQLIMSLFPQNIIISFPQTADFSNTTKGRIYKISGKISYSSAKTVLLARDHRSYVFMHKTFKAQCYETPDIVLTLRKWYVHERINNILFCFREDAEKWIPDSFISQIKQDCERMSCNIEVLDTHIGDEYINMNNKNQKLNDFLLRISLAKILITDRLHGMIFAYITGTPAIVFPNSNKKIQECYKWIENCGFIYYLDNYKEMSFSEFLNKVITVHPDLNILENNYQRFMKIFDRAIIDGIKCV